MVVYKSKKLTNVLDRNEQKAITSRPNMLRKRSTNVVSNDIINKKPVKSYHMSKTVSQDSKVKVAVTSPSKIEDITTKIDDSTKRNKSIEYTPIDKSNFNVNRFTKINDFHSKENRTVNYDPTYASIILQNMLKDEEHEIYKRPIFGKGSLQTEVDSVTRSIVINWLYEFVEEYQIETVVLFLAIHFLDIMFRLYTIDKQSIQLIASVCLFIACKLEENNPPHIDNFVSFTNYCYKRQDFIDYEQIIHNVILSNHINITTRYNFAKRYAAIAKLTEREESYMFFLLERSLYDVNMNYELMSKLASSVIHLTIQIMRDSNATIWSKDMILYTGYSEYDLISNIFSLYDVIWNNNHQHVINKYNTVKYYNISNVITTIHPSNIRFDRFTHQQAKIIHLNNNITPTIGSNYIINNYSNYKRDIIPINLSQIDINVTTKQSK